MVNKKTAPNTEAIPQRSVSKLDEAPCYFAVLKVKNVHCFGEEQSLILLNEKQDYARWTILLGDNGMGKTTLLQCLAAMSPSDTPVEGTNEKFWQLRAYGYREWYVNVRRESASDCHISASVIRTAGSKCRGNAIFFRSYIDEKGRDSNWSDCYDEKLAKLVVYGYGAMRRLHRADNVEVRNFDPCITLFDDDKALLNAEQWLRNADYAASKSDTKDAKLRLKMVEDLLVELLPDVEEIRISARGHEVPVPEAKTPFGWVPVNSLSTGYRSVLAWVIDFASRMMDRYPNVKDPFAMPAVVLVDQIDLFLHPKWQREVIERLTAIFKQTQFIVTAHSPLIVQAVPDANIALLKRVGDEVHILNQPAEVRGWRIDQLLASDLFENQPTRDDATEAMMDERQQLLAKSSLTAADKRRLKQLDMKLGEVEYGESPEQAEMLAVLKKAAKQISAKQ